MIFFLLVISVTFRALLFSNMRHSAKERVHLFLPIYEKYIFLIACRKQKFSDQVMIHMESQFIEIITSLSSYV